MEMGEADDDAPAGGGLAAGGAAARNDVLEVICPDCGSFLTIDPQTRAVIGHKKDPHAGKPKASFDDLASGFLKGKELADKKFEKAMEERKHRAEILEKKFREAQKRAEQEKDAPRPLRPFDLD
jgi:hypothetical protein